ncbi:transglycosylase domain-containing protein [Sporosarcina highlanderae]|uniref:PBP1A family penicillin-binding protein n=1 Tax=Sporosarcina highlanderae TaxID=3035916 RepID=A0ABT8JU64_9BACL|nr:PBP1A family penicillin-binding protein [Sporosarcina highlanderae]MDN4608705.1 PBP1A family penicillin-binding protein [Sporosarcina highlanderae]
MSDKINSRAARRQQMEAERKRGKNKKPKKNGNIIKKIILAIVAIGLAVFVGGLGLFAFYASSAPDLDESLLKDPLTSNIADRNGDVFMKLGAEKREFVPYNEIPKELENAILATEDVRFYKHHGMDFWRLGGAVLANFKSGFGSQGASTLTQQVIKNSFLTDEKTLKRKAQEAWLAFKLEREYEKEDIFEMYFNKILMSGRIHGIGTAAEYFYGKKLDELELHEMAMLAGLPQSPNGYNPFKNPERAEKRRNTVLTLMYKHKKITKEQMEEAKAIPVTQTLVPEDQRDENTNSQYLAYVDIVLDELEAAGMMDLLSEGVTIQTALDPKAQQAVERAINSDIYESDEMQAGMTVLDTKTGEIVAIGGGRNFTGRNLNFASGDNRRQPGSIIKPILSYGPIIEHESWSTAHTVVDEPYKYKGTNISLRNVDGKFLGPISAREALYKSRNIPAVKVFEEVGPKRAAQFANKLGLSYDKLESVIAIGGGRGQFSTIEMAGAYSAFGNGGIYTKPHAVKNVILRDGKTKVNLSPDPVTVMKDSTAYMVTDILRDVVTLGTGKTANVSGLDMAGKTGTTNYDADTKKKLGLRNTDVPDSWFTGYTTEYTISVWGGYKKPSTPITTFDRGRYVPQILFRKVMTDLVAGKKTPHFKQPSSVEQATIVKGSNPTILASKSTPDALKSTELFVRGTVPTEMDKEILTELDAPSGLSADYDNESNSVILNWTHNGPDTELLLGPVQFEVSVAVDGSEAQTMTTTTDQTVTFSNVELGRTYVFYVKAIAGDIESSPASTSVMIEGKKEPGFDNEDGDKGNEDDGENKNNGNDNDKNNNGNKGDNGNKGNNGNNGNNSGSDNSTDEGSGDSGNAGDDTGSGDDGKPDDGTDGGGQ